MTRRLALAATLLMFGACHAARRTGDTPLPDAGSPDAGARDAAGMDASLPDTGVPDEGTTDASTSDTGLPDAGAPDAGAPDAGAPDAGPRDAGPRDAGPVSAGVLFSEYVEGTANNKALELYNPTSSTLDLGTCTVRIYANGSATMTGSVTLSTTPLAPATTFVVCHPMATFAATCDQTSTGVAFNGNDAVELVCGGTTLDVIGQIGFDPGTEWGTGLTSTADDTLRRRCGIVAGDTNGADAFDPSLEWDGFATDDVTDLGMHACP